jgi:hypothetical protein
MLKGASGASAEVFFQLADATNPNNPILGQDFTTGSYVYLWTPILDAFVVVLTSQIKEKGRGTYAVQCTSAQSAQAGTAYVFAYVPGVSQPSRVMADIVDPLDPARWDLPFVIMPLADPVYDSGGTGLDYAFAGGEVATRFSTDLAFANVPVGQLVERGFNTYAVELTDAQRHNADGALVSLNVAPMVPFVAEWDMIVATYASSGPAPLPPAPPPFVPPVSTGPVDQVSAGLGRLALQFKTKVA